ncbi:36142_t:CDS:2, partial [Racocetra persica]
MEEHGVVIRVIGPYSHHGTAIVERFNKTLAKMLYKIQYSVESISSDPKLIRAWVKHLSKSIDTAYMIATECEGSWCPTCRGYDNTITDMQKLVQDKNGHCLSDTYHGYAPLYRIKNLGTWCPTCHGCFKTIDNARKYAIDKEGKCLSKTQKKEERCLSSKFIICLRNCLGACHEILIKYLGPPSKNHRPEFLKIHKYPCGLELDIPYYNYGLAIEVQGVQYK